MISSEEIQQYMELFPVSYYSSSEYSEECVECSVYNSTGVCFGVFYIHIPESKKDEILKYNIIDDCFIKKDNTETDSIKREIKIEEVKRNGIIKPIVRIF